MHEKYLKAQIGKEKEPEFPDAVMSDDRKIRVKFLIALN